MKYSKHPLCSISKVKRTFVIGIFIGESRHIKSSLLLLIEMHSVFFFIKCLVISFMCMALQFRLKWIPLNFGVEFLLENILIDYIALNLKYSFIKSSISRI